MCRVSAMMITSSFTFTFCDKTFRANTSQQVSPCRRPEMECVRKRHSDRSQQVHSSIMLQNRQSSACRSFQDQISWQKCPTAIILASVAGVDTYKIVRPCGMLLCVPKFGLVVLREHCLAHRTPLRSEGDRNVPRTELQIQGQLVCTRAVRRKSNVPSEISRLALSLGFCEEQIQYCL